MKFNRVFIVAIIVLMAAMLLFETSAPTRFNWDVYSQSYKSKQPFGCYVLDSVLRASLPQGYEVCGSDDEVFTDVRYTNGKHTFLFTNNYEDFVYSVDANLIRLIKDGNNVVLANGYYPSSDNISQQLGFSFQSMFKPTSTKEILSDPTRYDTINWYADAKFPPATYVINNAFFDGELELSGSYRTLATLTEKKEQYYASYYREDYTYVVAGTLDYGKGKVVVVSMPMIFTNYGILNDTIRPFVLRLLSECGDLPVVRYDPTYISHKADNEQDSDSPLRFLLANRPLRWAFYLALATLAAFVLFTAKRRQRVIPVIKPPVNHMMDFVKQIGDIYYQRHDNVDLLIKKYVTFSNDVRVKTMIDIDNYDHIDEELQMLSNRTGIPFDDLKKQILDVWNATHADSISNERLKQLIDVMNHILHKINI